MLRINSIMFTVLPTPAPPNSPTLPPLAKGQMARDDFFTSSEVTMKIFKLVKPPPRHGRSPPTLG